jgi:hypothetical protein
MVGEAPEAPATIAKRPLGICRIANFYVIKRADLSDIACFGRKCAPTIRGRSRSRGLCARSCICFGIARGLQSRISWRLLYDHKLWSVSRRVIGKALVVSAFKHLRFLFSDPVCQCTWRQQRVQWIR